MSNIDSEIGHRLSFGHIRHAKYLRIAVPELLGIPIQVNKSHRFSPSLARHSLTIAPVVLKGKYRITKLAVTFRQGNRYCQIIRQATRTHRISRKSIRSLGSFHPF